MNANCSTACSDNFDLSEALPYNQTFFSNSPDDSWKIEKIVASIEKNEGRFYKVKWVRYLWQSEESLQSIQPLLNEYWLNCGSNIDLGENNISCASDEKLLLNEIPSGEKNIELCNTTDAASNIYQNGSSVLYTSTEKFKASSSDISCSLAENNLILQNEACSTKENHVTVSEMLYSVEKRDESSPSEVSYETISQNQSESPDNKQNEIQANAALNGNIDSSVVTYCPDEHVINKEGDTASPPNAINFSMSYNQEKNFKCGKCEKAFNRKTSLQRHALIHTGEKPFHCNYCAKSFNQNSILQRHLLIHAKCKSFFCEICEKRFVEKGALQRHRATHSSKKCWFCDTCGKGFILKEYLSKHMFLHSGKKPYSCEKCTRTFADSSAFRRHQKVHHERGAGYCCSLCQKQHKDLLSLKRHEKRCNLSTFCVICKMNIGSHELLTSHIKIHLGPLKCNLCGSAVQTYEDYLCHIESHNTNSLLIQPQLQMENLLTDRKVYKEQIT